MIANIASTTGHHPSGLGAAPTTSLRPLKGIHLIIIIPRNGLVHPWVIMVGLAPLVSIKRLHLWVITTELVPPGLIKRLLQQLECTPRNNNNNNMSIGRRVLPYISNEPDLPWATNSKAHNIPR